MHVRVFATFRSTLLLPARCVSLTCRFCAGTPEAAELFHKQSDNYLSNQVDPYTIFLRWVVFSRHRFTLPDGFR